MSNNLNSNLDDKKCVWVEVEFFRYIVSFVELNRKTPKVFISGSISKRKDTYKDYFRKAEQFMEEIGLEYYSPTSLPEGLTWDESIELTLKELEDCDCMYILKDWEGSEGVRREVIKASELKTPVFYE